jgi:predicted dithiol-disulfide oxidoreductase (DUF899 family)
MNNVKTIELPKVVSHAEWLRARKELLGKEKEWIRQRADQSGARRKLPMERVEKNYVFEGPGGRRTLGDLFESRRQLIVYHFMFEPDEDEGCSHCSFVVDHFGGALIHLAARETSLAVISRAPIAKIEHFKKRMGWTFPWLSSFGNDFNHDFQVTIDEAHPENNYRRAYHESDLEGKGPTEGEAPGLSAFLRDGQKLYHTYSTYLRGLDPFITTYALLDHTPLGRQEGADCPPMSWVRYHDEY